MDLTPSETQRDLVALATRILADAADRSTPPAQLWGLLADAGLLGVTVPEELGGLGLGFSDLGLVLEAAGRVATSVPLLEAGVAATVLRETAGDIHHGPPVETLLRDVASGAAVLGLALGEPIGNPLAPLVCAAGERGRWTLSGTKLGPGSDPSPTHLLLSAHLAGIGPRLLVLGADRAGLSVGSGSVRLDHVAVGLDDVLGGLAAAGAVALAVRAATAAACSVMAGAAAEALRLTAAYVGTREQFGRPIGSFQAVGQRAADAYTAAWSIELTARQVCWHVEAGPGGDAERAVAVAKYTAATAGAAVVRAGHHLHGGIGLDRDYPLPHYTVLAKRLELLLGGASQQAETLGDLLASAAIQAAAPAAVQTGTV